MASNEKKRWHDINSTGSYRGGGKQETEEEEWERLARTPSTSEKAWEWEQQQKEKRTSQSSSGGFAIHSLSWRHVDEAKKGNTEARNGDTIRLLCGVEGCSDKTSVRFEVSYKTAKGEIAQFASSSGTLKDGTAAVDITLNFAKIKADEYTIYFTPSVQGKYGKNCDIPLAPPILECAVVELPDVCFNAESPMPCLDENGIFEAALVAAFKFAKENSGKEAIVFGHGGKTGTPADEFDLSKQRAELLLCLLNGGQDRFVEIAGLCATIKDWQTCLVALAERYGWDCDPGKPDGKAGTITSKATEAFKKHCKEKLTIACEVNSKIDDASWCTMYDVMRKVIEDTIKQGPLSSPTLSSTSNGFYPCGNAFKPEGTGIRSKDGRRVEIVFFAKGKVPTLAVHTNKAELVTVQKCPVYDIRQTKKAFVEYTPIESSVLKIKEIDGSAHVVHNEKAVYTVKSFNRDVSVEEKKTVGWAIRIEGKEVERHEKAGTQFEFQAVGKYAGETITVHPFLHSPSDKLCVKTTVGLCLVFEHNELVWLDESHKEVKKWHATSGDKTHTDDTKEGGPIPEGRYVVVKGTGTHTSDDTWVQQTANASELKEFGTDKIEVIPFKTTDTHGRKRFYIHGGKEEGSAHGIDLTSKIKEFVDEFNKCGKSLVLVVRGGEQPTKSAQWKLGSLSMEFETGGRGPATVSSGTGDAGGVSYGSYQMTSALNGGTAKLFVQSSTFPWAIKFAGLTAGTQTFTEKWKAVVAENKDAFVKAEHDYIKRTHYDLLVNKVKQDNNVDVIEHSKTLNDVIWSTAVQQGGGTGIVGKAIAKINKPASKTKDYDEELIKQIYAERGRKKTDGTLAYFPNCSTDVQNGVAKRYVLELKKALEELQDENY